MLNVISRRETIQDKQHTHVIRLPFAPFVSFFFSLLEKP